MVPPPARRRLDRGPTSRGELTSLASNRPTTNATSSMFHDLPSQSDDDLDDELLLSQPTMTERIMSMSQETGSNGAVNMPKKKPSTKTSKRGGAAASSSKRTPPNRKRKPDANETPATSSVPTRSSARLKGRSKVVYEAAEAESESNSDGDFQSPDHRSSVRSSGKKKSKKKRGRPSPKLKSRHDDSGYESESLGILDFGPPKRKRLRKNEKIPEKVQWEIDRRMLSAADSDLIGSVYREFYKAPPSNLRAAARYRLIHGRDPTDAEADELWQTVFKPWSDRWYSLKDIFTDECRQKKKNKPKDKDPALKKREVKRWIQAFFEKHGDIEPPELPEKFQKKPTVSKRKNPPKQSKKSPMKRQGTRRSARVANSLKSQNEDVIMSVEDQQNENVEMNNDKVEIKSKNEKDAVNNEPNRKVKKDLVKLEKLDVVELDRNGDTVNKAKESKTVADIGEMKSMKNSTAQAMSVEDEKKVDIADKSIALDRNDDATSREPSIAPAVTLSIMDNVVVIDQKPSTPQENRASEAETQKSNQAAISQNGGAKETIVELETENAELEETPVDRNCESRGVERVSHGCASEGHVLILSIIEELLSRVDTFKKPGNSMVDTAERVTDVAAQPESAIVVSDDSSDTEPKMLPSRRRSMPRNARRDFTRR